LSSVPPKTGRGLEKIKLYDSSGKVIGVKTFFEAESMAKKDHLMLIRKEDETAVKYKCFILVDPKTNLDKKPEGKGPREKKKLTMGANIGNHDIITKAKQITKFLSDNAEVQVLVYGQTTNQRLEEIYDEFQKLFPGLRFVQKVVKTNTLKFTVLPDQDKLSNLDFSKTKSTNHETEVSDSSDLIDQQEVEEMIQEKLKKK